MPGRIKARASRLGEFIRGSRKVETTFLPEAKPSERASQWMNEWKNSSRLGGRANHFPAFIPHKKEVQCKSATVIEKLLPAQTHRRQDGSGERSRGFGYCLCLCCLYPGKQQELNRKGKQVRPATHFLTSLAVCPILRQADHERLNPPWDGAPRRFVLIWVSLLLDTCTIRHRYNRRRQERRENIVRTYIE